MTPKIIPIFCLDKFDKFCIRYIDHSLKIKFKIPSKS